MRLIPTHERLFIAVEICGSMASAAERGKTRLQAACARLDALLATAPRDMYITLLAFASRPTLLMYEATATQLRALLGTLQANAGGSACAGLVLETVLTQYMRPRPYHSSNLLLVTDGNPTDRSRYEAWLDFNTKHDNALALYVMSMSSEVSPEVMTHNLPRHCIVSSDFALEFIAPAAGPRIIDEVGPQMLERVMDSEAASAPHPPPPPPPPPRAKKVRK